MYKILYTVDSVKADDEKEWLREQMIFPSTNEVYDWKNDKHVTRFAIIVGSEAALAVKLRHKVEFQDEYRQFSRRT